MLIGTALIALGLFFFVATLLTVHPRTRDRWPHRQLYLTCAGAGVLVFLAVAITPWGGAGTQTMAISFSWFIAASLFIISLVALAARGLERFGRAPSGTV